MADTYARSVVLLELDAGSGETAYLTNAEDRVTIGPNTYLSSPEMEIKPSATVGDLGQGEYKIENIGSAYQLVSRLADNVPYASVAVILKEIFYDDADAIVKTEHLFKGLVYTVESKRAAGLVSLVCRDYLYYLDTTAGMPCTEQCAIPVFGDTLCGASVVSESHVVFGITGFELTITDSLSHTTAFLFNKGYIKFGAAQIKIQYHETGKVFTMARPVPAYWLGETVEVVSGCDRRLETCIGIHSNEERFLGLGHAMVDYNPMYENP